MTYKERIALQAQLDKQFKKWPMVGLSRVPARGWIYTLRDALGMTTMQLARRMGVKQSTLARFEKSEAKKRIQLETLERVARALNCTLVYALVPNLPLETYYAERLLEKAGRTMKLKPRHFDSGLYRMMLEGYAEKIRAKDVWEG